MSSTAPTKRDLETNTLPSGKGVLDWVKPFLTTTVGMKVTTALTGAALTGFVISHLIGNLKIFDGRDALNGYAHFLKELGPWLWVARIGLLTVFVVHIVFALYLKKKSLAARPVKYAYEKTVQASVASRTMHWTGLVILAFTLFHLAHYTLGMIGTAEARHNVTGKLVQVSYLDLLDEKGRPDVYSMVIAGFHNDVVCVLYVIAQLILMVHLSHGIASVFQSLGLNTPRLQPALRKLAWGVAIVLALGNIAIVGAVRLNFLGDSYMPVTRVGDTPPPMQTGLPVDANTPPAKK